MSQTQKIAIFVPKGLRTGGPESMHQLHYELVQQDINSILIPYPGTSKLNEVEEYSKYKPNWSNVSRLSKNDIVIVPCDLNYLPYWNFLFISKRNLFSWMLAVDFCSDGEFRRYESKNYPLSNVWQKQIIKKSFYKSLINRILNTNLLSHLRENPYKKIGRKKLIFQVNNFLFQSYYAKNIFKKRKHSNEGLMLTDYINIENFNNISKLSYCDCDKKHIPYFPSKSKLLMEFILKVNLHNAELIHFIPMENIPKSQVMNILAFSDLYLDLGFFPGKDRLPREAILVNCPVLLAKRGSARYHDDFPLEEKYLLDLNILNPDQVYKILLYTLSLGKDYNLKMQSHFKNFVLREEKVFKEEVVKFLIYTKFRS